MKNLKNFVFAMLILVLCVCTTGCGIDEAADAANSAKETVVATASDAKKQVDWWTRSTDNQSWTNPSGTKITITERRKQGDFEITVTYDTSDLESWGEEKYTESPTVVMYVDQISDELIDELREQ